MRADRPTFTTDHEICAKFVRFSFQVLAPIQPQLMVRTSNSFHPSDPHGTFMSKPYITIFSLCIIGGFLLSCGPIQKYPNTWPSLSDSTQIPLEYFNQGLFENKGLDAKNHVVYLSDILLRLGHEPKSPEDQTRINNLFVSLRSKPEVRLFATDDNHLLIDFISENQVTHLNIDDAPNKIKRQEGHLLAETSRFISRELVTENWRFSIALYHFGNDLYINTKDESIGIMVLFPAWTRESTWCRFRGIKPSMPNP
jgi:hypothetical protein